MNLSKIGKTVLASLAFLVILCALNPHVHAMSSEEREALNARKIRNLLPISIQLTPEQAGTKKSLFVGFTNASNKTIIGIRYYVRILDGFGNEQSSSISNIEVPIQSGETYYRDFSISLSRKMLPPGFIPITIKVSGIVFQDGESLMLTNPRGY